MYRVSRTRRRNRSAREDDDDGIVRSNCSGCTVIIARYELLSQIGMPGQNLDEIGDEGRNGALQNGTVSTDRVLLVHVCVVVLRHHCTTLPLNYMLTEISRATAALQSLVNHLVSNVSRPALRSHAALNAPRPVIGSPLLRSRGLQRSIRRFRD